MPSLRAYRSRRRRRLLDSAVQGAAGRRADAASATRSPGPRREGSIALPATFRARGNTTTYLASYVAGHRRRLPPGQKRPEAGRRARAVASRCGRGDLGAGARARCRARRRTALRVERPGVGRRRAASRPVKLADVPAEGSAFKGLSELLGGRPAVRRLGHDSSSRRIFSLSPAALARTTCSTTRGGSCPGIHTTTWQCWPVS